MNRSIEVSQSFDQGYLWAQKSLVADGSRVSGCHFLKLLVAREQQRRRLFTRARMNGLLTGGWLAWSPIKGPAPQSDLCSELCSVNCLIRTRFRKGAL